MPTQCPECYAAAHTGLCARRPSNHYYPAPNFVVAGVWPSPPVIAASMSAAEAAYHLDADGDLAGYDGP